MNPLDPDLFVSGTPHALFHELRARAPVQRAETHEGPCVLVLDHANALRVLRDPWTYSSTCGVGITSRPGDGERPLFRALQLSDPPLHGKLRRLVGAPFEAAAIAAREPALRARARALFDRLAGERPADVSEPLVALALEPTCELVGLDEPARVQDVARRVIFAADGPSRATAERELRELLEATIAGRRRRPREDLVSSLLEARLDGERFGSEDTVWLLRLLVLAGHRTTAAALAAGLLALAHQGVVATSDGVEELLRFTSPIVRFGRVATRDVELGGELVRAGERVAVVFPAVDRDPAVFAEPDRLDLARRPNPHLALGAGPHLCLGEGLARLVLRVALDEVRDRELELVGPVAWWRSSFLAAPRTLALKIGMR